MSIFKKIFPVLVLAFCLSFPLNAMTFEVMDIGTLDSDSSKATLINDQGEVYGKYRLDGCVFHFLWNEENGLVVIDLPKNSKPVHLNNCGQLVGNIQHKNGTTGGFIWDQESGFTELGTLGGKNTWVKDSNDYGQVVGQSDVNDSESHAFVWQDGVITDLGVLSGDQDFPGNESCANSINNLGEIVGYSNYPLVHKGKKIFSQERAILWKEGELVELYPIPHGTNRALAINNHSQIFISNTGLLNIKSGELKALDDNFIYVRLNDQGNMITDYQFVESVEPVRSYPCDWRWHRHQLENSLEKSGWTYLEKIADLNNSDSIVGTAENIYGEKHAVLFTRVD